MATRRRTSGPRQSPHRKRGGGGDDSAQGSSIDRLVQVVDRLYAPEYRAARRIIHRRLRKKQMGSRGKKPPLPPEETLYEQIMRFRNGQRGSNGSPPVTTPSHNSATGSRNDTTNRSRNNTSGSRSDSSNRNNATQRQSPRANDRQPRKAQYSKAASRTSNRSQPRLSGRSKKYEPNNNRPPSKSTKEASSPYDRVGSKSSFDSVELPPFEDEEEEKIPTPKPTKQETVHNEQNRAYRKRDDAIKNEEPTTARDVYVEMGDEGDDSPKRSSRHSSRQEGLPPVREATPRRNDRPLSRASSDLNRHAVVPPISPANQRREAERSGGHRSSNNSRNSDSERNRSGSDPDRNRPRSDPDRNRYGSDFGRNNSRSDPERNRSDSGRDNSRSDPDQNRSPSDSERNRSGRDSDREGDSARSKGNSGQSRAAMDPDRSNDNNDREQSSKSKSSNREDDDSKHRGSSSKSNKGRGGSPDSDDARAIILSPRDRSPSPEVPQQSVDDGPVEERSADAHRAPSGRSDGPDDDPDSPPDSPDLPRRSRPPADEDSRITALDKLADYNLKTLAGQDAGEAPQIDEKIMNEVFSPEFQKNLDNFLKA